MELTLGPILYEWKRDEVLEFYREISASPVDRVYLGEVVCAKKRGLGIEDIVSIAEMLTGAGKKVVLSSLAVVSNEEELTLTREMVKLPYPIEANDMSVLNMTDPSEREVVAGPHITTYNVPSMEFLRSLGIRRVTFPVELSGESIAYNIRHTEMEGEVFCHGKVPLAFSWRCYTSRAHGLTKTECRHNCMDDPEGMVISTVDGEPLFTINGTSILSAAAYTLCGFEEELRYMGVTALRISPQYRDTVKVIDIFSKRMAGSIEAAEAVTKLRELCPGGHLCNGWFTAGAGKDYIERAVLQHLPSA